MNLDTLLSQLKIMPSNPGACFGATGWSSAQENKIVSYSPANNAPIAEVFGASMTDYETAMTHAQKAFDHWRKVPAPLRGEVVRHLGNQLRANKDALGSLVSLEMGKSKQEGDGEVQEMIDIADFAVGQSRMLYGNTMHSERVQHRMYEQWHPYGIVGIITAFNFPVAVWAWNACIAAICGNVCLWKPSSKVPLSAIAVQHICNEVMRAMQLPPIFQLIIPSDHSIADKMVNDERIPLVSFTGSTPTGKQVAEKVARRLGHTILELGGNNAIIVDETADLSIAIPGIVFGAVGTAGQRCTTTRRLFLQETIFDNVMEKLVGAYGQLKIGDPLDKHNHMGPLIDESAVKGFEAAMVSIKEAGGKIAFGGEVLPQPGFYVQPTLVTDLDNAAQIVQTETFAPILYVMPFKDLDEAIAKQNGVKQGLSSAIFTNHLRHAESFLSAMGSDCGIANVNIGTSGAEIGGAFGGEKETGGGRESGSDAWKGYMRRQTNTINWGNALPLAQGIEFNLS